MRWHLLSLLVATFAATAPAQDADTSPPLPRRRLRNGDETLRAFAPISTATRASIVKLRVDGTTVALGTVMDANGLTLTKASELEKGKLTCWLASDQEVGAKLVATDEEEDLALVQVQAPNLKPIQWARGDVVIGQWAVSPGIAETPHAVGIISAVPRRIRPPRALIGVRFDFNAPNPRIEEILSGMGAEKAGLKPGDIIVAVNGTSMTNRDHVVESLREFGDGQTVTLRLRRGETQFDAPVRMTSPKSGQLAAEMSPRSRSSRLMGEVSQRSEGFEKAIEHDCVLQPWLCGGPLVNVDGKAVGINIARASRVTTYALPASLIQRTYERLKHASHP